VELKPADQAPRDSSKPRTYRQRPQARIGNKEATPKPCDAAAANVAFDAMVKELENEAEQSQLIGDLDDLLGQLDTQSVVSDLDALLNELARKSTGNSEQRCDPAAASQDFEAMLKELDDEHAAASLHQAFSEVDQLLDQLDHELALKDQTSTAQRNWAGKVTAIHDAQVRLDKSTDELTSLMNAIQRDVVRSHTAYIASTSEMRSEAKVAVAAQAIGTEAVTTSLDAQQPLKAPVFRRPVQPLVSEAVALPTEPVIESTR